MKLISAVLLFTASSAAAFSPSSRAGSKLATVAATKSTVTCPRTPLYLSASAASVSANDDSGGSATSEAVQTKQQKRLQQIKNEGGILAFNTKFGALNPYGIFYGLTSIALGLVWFVALLASQLFYKVTGSKLDKKRRIPVTLNHIWGTLLMLFTGCFPKIENGDLIKKFHKR